ncbi:autotransporter domain-containing protein [Paraburkholderia megapolitana]|nr:autotransporter domain-containing protein [Paraburkholderia megapolitana]MDN7158089.1 autotransporter domain-containing protein [Paraburkholderia sp. CHISQ3]MDQ6495136.1 autotransporter domain-containing protein [Paraburkholderia megapolitana]
MQFLTDGYTLTGGALTLVGQSGVAPVVRVSSGATATIDNVLTGTSGLNKTDGGTLVLNGTNTYQGATTLSGGYLSVASDENLGQSTNVLDFAGGSLKVTGTSFNQTSRNIVWGSAGGGFDIDAAANTFTVAQALTGTGGLLKSGAGTLLLNGQNTYSGGTILNAGMLEVGDADHTAASLAGDVQVNATSTLRGHGTVAGNIANNGGTVAPGGSVGTLNVGGNYTQASNGSLAVEVSPTAASLLNVTGTATLNGVLAITYDPGTYTAKQYTLVAAGQGVSGQFSSVTKTLSSGADLGALQQNVTYTGNQVELALANASVGTTNPGNPGNPSNPGGTVVVAPKDISIYTALGSSVSMGSQAANSTLLARMNHASAATAGAPGGWIDATGAQTHVGGANNEPGYQADRYGFLAGLDSKVGDYTLGVAAGYAHTDIDEQQTGDSATADTLRIAVYGNRWFGPVGVSATAGYALDFLSQKRPFGPAGTAEGDHIGHELTAGGQASMPLTFGSFVVTPSMGLRFAYLHANGFGESGAGGQDLNVGTDNVQSLQPYAQVTFDKAFGDALRPIDLQLRLGYAHELLNANRTVSVTAQDGTVFAAPGTSLPRGYLSAGVSLQMEPTKAMTVSVGYDALINTTHASAQAASVKVGYTF